jgi:hypothetical protein
MHSKLNFVEAISTCFFAMLRFYFVYFCRQEARKRRAKAEKKKEGLSSISGEQLPFTTGLRHSYRRAALSLPSPSLSSVFSTVLQCEQWKVTGLQRFHRPLVHHRHAALPIPLPLRLGCSPLFCKVNSGE